MSVTLRPFLPADGERLAVDRRHILGAVKLAGDRVAQTDFFHESPPGIAFTNGFVSAKGNKIQLEPCAPGHRARAALPFPYDPNADAGRFAQYLDEIFAVDEDCETKKALLQEIAGASLLGLAPRYETAAFLVGTGNNGKSVLIKLIRALFPKGTVASVRPQDFESEYYRARLVGVRLNLVTEVPNTELISGAFKNIVSGELIGARQPSGRVFEFTPINANWFALNELPRVADTTFGFFRKVAVIAFNRRFTAAEADKHLAEYIIEHELPGIAAWAIAGASRLVKQGSYTEPASSLEAREAWRSDADMVMTFIDECCTRPRNGELMALASETEIDELYEHYRAWAKHCGHTRIMVKQTLGKRFKSLGYVPRSSNGTTLYALAVHSPPPTSTYTN